MLKERVIYNEIINIDNYLEEVEQEIDVRFLYSVTAIKLYEQKVQSNFFTDYQLAWNELISSLKGYDINNIKEASIEKQIELSSILMNPIINTFILNVLPCLYIEIDGMNYIQNEDTYEICESAMWLTNLVNLEFFVNLFSEISAFENKKKQKDKKTIQKT